MNKKRLIVIAVILTALAAAAAVFLPGQASASARIATQICQIPSPSAANCLSAPHTGGSGTPITLQTRTSGANQQYSERGDPSFCNGHGTVQSGCGLPSFLVSRYRNHPAVVFQNSAGKCLKIAGPGPSSGFAQLGTCFDGNTLLIVGTCSNNLCYYPSITESETIGTTEWLCAPPVGKQVYTGAGSRCDASHWEYLSS